MRKKRVLEQTTTAEAKQPRQGDWVEAWDPHEKCNYYYNVTTEETSWEPPTSWTSEETTGYGRGRSTPSTAATAATTPIPTPTPDETLPHMERTATGPQRFNAATRIQTRLRMYLARKEVAAMHEVERRSQLRRGSAELLPQENFRLAGQKLRSEIKQSRRLVAMKEKRIEQLEQGMDDRKAESDLRRAEMVSLQKKLDSEREEVQKLEKIKDNNNQSLKQINALVVEKDSVIQLKLAEIQTQQESLNQAKTMLKRRDNAIKKKDVQIQNMQPETEEVCLSARSFSENMMINLRDQAIDAKEQQLDLLNHQNEDLSVNITRVESEVEKMQKDLLKKDTELTVRRKKITHLTNNIDRLERELQKKGGEEAAIELTNKQNAHLLVLLQQHEAKTEQLEEVRTELEEGKAASVVLWWWVGGGGGGGVQFSFPLFNDLYSRLFSPSLLCSIGRTSPTARVIDETIGQF